jgi:hypothetical protein
MAFCARYLRQAGGQTDRLNDPPTTHFMRRIPTGTICAAPGFGHFSGCNDPIADQLDKILDCSLKESNKYQVVVITVTGT